MWRRNGTLCCQNVHIFNYEKHYWKVLSFNVSLTYNLQDWLNHFIILTQANKHPPHLLILKYPHDPKLIRSPVYPYLDLINFIRYLLISNWFTQILFLSLDIPFSLNQICPGMCSSKWWCFLKKSVSQTKATQNLISWSISFLERAKNILRRVL